MKARVFKNGKIVNVYPKEDADYAGRLKYIEKGKGLSYYEDELDFIDYSDEPDYWEKLKHQYAGMAMQGLVMNPKLCEIETSISIANTATTIASALIDKLKEESQCEK